MFWSKVREHSGARSQHIGIRSEHIGLRSERVRIRSEHIGVRSEQGQSMLKQPARQDGPCKPWNKVRAFLGMVCQGSAAQSQQRRVSGTGSAAQGQRHRVSRTGSAAQGRLHRDCGTWSSGKGPLPFTSSCVKEKISVHLCETNASTWVDHCLKIKINQNYKAR